MARKQTKSRKKTAKAKLPQRHRAPRRNKPVRRGAQGPRSLARIHQGVGLEKGGQSGDVQGLSNLEDADSESVSELVEEGQAFEAGIVDGVESAPDPDKGNLRTQEVPEDDVSPEYRGYREDED